MGDAHYGSTASFGPAYEDERLQAIALHARSLTFRHPMTREIVTATAPLARRLDNTGGGSPRKPNRATIVGWAVPTEDSPHNHVIGGQGPPHKKMTSPQRKTDPFHARDTFNTGAARAGIYRLSKLEDAGLGKISKLPYSIRVLLESVLRCCDGYEVREEDVQNLAGWNAASPARVEIPFKPARVVLQDFTGVPAVVDLAAMRSAMKRLGGDPKRINPADPGSIW